MEMPVARSVPSEKALLDTLGTPFEDLESAVKQKRKQLICELSPSQLI